MKRKGIIGEGFLKNSSRMSFTLALPALAFLKIAPLDFNRVFNVREIFLVCSLTLGAYILALLFSTKTKDKFQKGVVIQGAFRGNVAIVGLALILNLYGEEMLARGAMILAFLLPIFNIFSVIALTVPIHGFTPAGLSHSLKSILKNPIILSVIGAMFFSLFHLPVPKVVNNFLGYLAALALPLALITIGGSLSANGIKTKGLTALAPSVIKMLILPTAGVTIFYLLGYRSADLGMIFLILGAPTAVSSHIMADAMGNDEELAALVVTITTALSAFTTMLGIGIIESLS